MTHRDIQELRYCPDMDSVVNGVRRAATAGNPISREDFLTAVSDRPCTQDQARSLLQACCPDPDGLDDAREGPYGHIITWAQRKLADDLQPPPGTPDTAQSTHSTVEIGLRGNVYFAGELDSDQIDQQRVTAGRDKDAYWLSYILNDSDISGVTLCIEPLSDRALVDPMIFEGVGSSIQQLSADHANMLVIYELGPSDLKTVFEILNSIDLDKQPEVGISQAYLKILDSPDPETQVAQLLSECSDSIGYAQKLLERFRDTSDLIESTQTLKRAFRACCALGQIDPEIAGLAVKAAVVVGRRLQHVDPKRLSYSMKELKGYLKTIDFSIESSGTAGSQSLNFNLEASLFESTSAIKLVAGSPVFDAQTIFLCVWPWRFEF